jgi:hypothetical protein
MVDVPLAGTPAGVDSEVWAAACAAVRAYCGWHVAPVVTEDVVLDGNGSSLLTLPTLRLTDLTITNDGTLVTDPEWSQAGMVRTSGCWTSKFRGISATMTHGFETCPDEVLQVAKDMAAAASRVGASGMVAGPYQVQYGQTSAGAEGGSVGISGEQARRLAPYRIPPRP